MKTTLFLSVSIDGFIADKERIHFFIEEAEDDWYDLINEAKNVIAGRSSYVQSISDEAALVLNPKHKIALSSRDLELVGTFWQHVKSPSEVLEILKRRGIDERIVGLAVMYHLLS